MSQSDICSSQPLQRVLAGWYDWFEGVHTVTVPCDIDWQVRANNQIVLEVQAANRVRKERLCQWDDKKTAGGS